MRESKDLPLGDTPTLYILKLWVFLVEYLNIWFRPFKGCKTLT